MPVTLTKGQKISLEKEAGTKLTKVVMGLGWDAKKAQVDVVWFRQLRSKDGSITHSGDNLTGAGAGDDEQIVVDLTRVPATVKTLVFVVNSFTGQNFSQIENAFCRMVDQANNREIARYDLSGGGSHTAQVMVKVYRHNDEWKMHALGETCNGRTFVELLPVIKPLL